LKQYESGEKVADICRKLGVSQASFYTWKKQYAGMGVQELRELRQLRDENGRWKTAGGGSFFGPADSAGDRLKKAVKPRQRCRLVRWTQEAYQMGARRAARLVRIPWTTLLYKSRKPSQEALRRRLREVASTHVRYGYRRMTVLLKREGWKINGKRVYRLYDEENLKVRSVERKKITRRQRVPQAQANGPNQCWSADFVSDKLSDVPSAS
jgi:putative transposase